MIMIFLFLQLLQGTPTPSRVYSRKQGYACVIKKKRQESQLKRQNCDLKVLTGKKAFYISKRILLVVPAQVAKISPAFTGRCVFRTQSNIYVGAFCENSYRLSAVNCFCKKAKSQMFDWVLNTPPTSSFFCKFVQLH